MSRQKVTGIFRNVLGDQRAEVELGRAHRVLGPKPTDLDRPRDVVDHPRQAWDQGEIEVDGAQIRITPNLSRATMHRRALLRHLLDPYKQTGHTYRWGYPLAVTFRKDTNAFTLQTAADLPSLFRFMGAEPKKVPDWLQFLPRQSGCSGRRYSEVPCHPARREVDGGAILPGEKRHASRP